MPVISYQLANQKKSATATATLPMSFSFTIPDYRTATAILVTLKAFS